MRARTLPLLLVVAFVPACSRAPAPPAPAAAATAPDAHVDHAALERIEEATEEFANRALDLSLAARSQLADQLVPFFADSVTIGLAEPAADLAPEYRDVSKRSWTPAAETTVDARAASVALERLLLHWSSIEDVRIKLKTSTPDLAATPPTVDAHFKGWIVGRNQAGQREWLRWTGHLEGVRVDDAWRITHLSHDPCASLVSARDLFSEVSRPAGVRRRDPTLAERGGRGLVSHGAAAADVNNDGLVDVFAAGLSRHALFLNRGDGTFEDAAESARVAHSSGAGVGPLFLDMDGDGDQDLFLSSVGTQSLFENRLIPDGTLVFRDVTAKSGVGIERSAFSAAAGDVNGDGRPDIVVACYANYGVVVPDSWAGATNGEPNLLFLNMGDGTFREAAVEAGVADSRWSYATLIADLDEDGDLDIVTGNDFGGPNGFFVNDGAGRFTDRAREMGLAEPGYAMGLSVGDPDADGDLDLHVTKMSSNAGNRILGRFDAADLPSKATLAVLAAGNSLHENIGGGRFQEITREAGPFASSWAWGGGFTDLDCDGFADIYTPNGFLSGSGFKDT